MSKGFAVTTAFIASPMAPVFLSIPYEYMASGTIEHLSPMVFICTLYGYLVMFFLAMPLYLFSGKKTPEFRTILALGASVGALVPMIVFAPPVILMSLDDDWYSDLAELFTYLLSGIFFGGASGVVFWLLAYSWRQENSSK